MNIFIQLLFLTIGFTLLMKGADFFVDGASSLADKLGIPQIVIGLTIVAFGTSAPEAAISITAALKGGADLAVSNVIGSNLLNVLLILGIASTITPLALQKSTLVYEIPFTALITGLLIILGLTGNQLNRFDGLFLLLLLGVFMFYLVKLSKAHIANTDEPPIPKMSSWKMFLFIILGGTGIVLGSQLSVDAATEIAVTFGLSQRIIGLTIIAFGTSLPELITSVNAARKKNADIAIGNIIGSNIFNILFVLGAASTITPISYINHFVSDNLFALLSVLLLFLLTFKKLSLKRLGGIIMIITYVIYFIFILL